MEDKVKICAEIGINHNGNIHLAHELIRKAAEAGADYAKFQLYTPEILFNNSEEMHLIAEAKTCQLSFSDLDKILKFCDMYGIKPLFSVFDDIYLKWLIDNNAQEYKIASRTSSRNPEFMLKVLELGKPTYIANGMNIPSDYMQKLQTYKNAKIINCVSLYPASIADYKWTPFRYYNDLFYGISDHTPGIELALHAISHGAKFVEKHFTLNKTTPGSDHSFSITPDELTDLVKYGQLISNVCNEFKKVLI